MADTTVSSFKILEKNVYCKGTPKFKSTPSARCQCWEEHKICTPETCINALTQVECSVSSCPYGHRCQNRRLQVNEFPKVEIRPCGIKGLGLFAMETIEPHQIVCEYRGELVTFSEYERRHKRYRSKGLNHFYFMMLQRDVVIDATEKGTLARFLNHSCTPNCEIQQWIVEGEPRMAVVAISLISAGDELGFDYGCKHLGDANVACFCGGKNCRGSLGPIKTDLSHRIKRRKSNNMFSKSSSSPSKLSMWSKPKSTGISQQDKKAPPLLSAQAPHEKVDDATTISTITTKEDEDSNIRQQQSQKHQSI